MKKWISITNRQIEELLGGLSYSGVSKAHQRFLEKVKTDKKLGRKVQEFTGEVSHVKG